MEEASEAPEEAFEAPEAVEAKEWSASIARW